MYGAILGDIIGSPYEFDSHNIKTKAFELFSDRSEFTDDSIMTLAVGEALMDVSRDASDEEIARAVSEERNRLRFAAYDGNPEGLEEMKKSNLETYGHEEGPLPDELFEQYGSWEMVLEKSFSVNSGMDACLGLYDDYYDLYVLAGQVQDDDGV